MNIRRHGLSPLFTIYLVSFFFTLHAALPVYINSSFLGTLVPEQWVGMIFTLSSLLGIAALIIIPKILRLIGDYFATVFFIVGEIAALIGIAASSSAAPIIPFFIASSVFITLISFDFDLIVERLSINASTGSTRGLYLTSANIAWVIAPAVAAWLLTTDQYWRVYLGAAALFIPALLIFARKLEHFRDPLYRTIQFKKSIAVVWGNRDLRNIFCISFLLQFFFTVMVIYTPIYLHTYIGFPWEKLGIIFSIMLIPFLLLEAWLGRLADKSLGEKELLIAGFAIMALATAAVSFVTASSFALWAVILFMTRVGAAIVEVMVETYFFKKIGPADAHLVGLHRTLRPFAGMLGPLTATAFLFFLPLQYVFVSLGALMLFGIPFALALKDTK